MSRVLFILAGYPASGKSTVLEKALANNWPLFGTRFNHQFQRTRLPPIYPEWRLSGDEILSNGCWFGGRNIGFLNSLERLPDQVVLHLDLLHLATIWDHFPPLDEEALARFPRQASGLSSEIENDSFFALALGHELYRKFEHIIINTLYVPWETNARQWRDRLSKNPGLGDFKAPLFDPTRPMKGGHRELYSSWFGNLALLNPAEVYLTVNDSRGVSVKPYPVGARPALPESQLLPADPC